MKKLIIILVVVLVVIGGGIVVKKKFFSSVVVVQTPSANSGSLALPENQEKGVDVSLTANANKTSVTLEVSKISKDMVSIEYELSYETAKGLLTGVNGKVKLEGQDLITRKITLGSCSTGGKCVYDEGVTKISLTLKFNKVSGQATGFNKDYEL